jgi:hypothetical protein
VWLTTAATYNASIPFFNQTIQWAALIDGWDGFALLVDDVQRYAGPALNFSLASLNATIPHFFRLAVSNINYFRPFRIFNGLFVISIPQVAPQEISPWLLRSGRMGLG